MKQSLAIFDLDNTLLAGDSDHAWGEFLVEQSLVDPVTHKDQNDKFYEDYCRGELDILAYQRFALSTIAGKTPQELKSLHDQFMTSYVEPMFLPAAMELLDKHRQQDHLLMIITATNDFITAPIAKRLGVDHLLACTADISGGVFTGDIVGIPCFQEGKVKRLMEWLDSNDHSLDGSFFYSDSHNDIPLLETVDHAVAVDADERLTAHANKEGWPVISLR